MFSIITSSYNEKYFLSLKANIEDTCRFPYEIIKIHNPGKIGICEAYNLGAAKAEYPYLIFCHEDLLIKSNDWGDKIINHFSGNANLGALGVAGASFVPYTFIGWDTYLGENARLNLIQQYKNGKKEHLRVGYNGKTSRQVKGLDGCFIATKKEIWDKIHFDQDTFRGFHFYDLDFSLRVSCKFDVCVIYDILIEHFSEGGYNESWLKELQVFNRKWLTKLPYGEGVNVREAELIAQYRYLEMSIKNNFPIRYYILHILKPKFIAVIGLKEYMLNLLKLPLRLFKLYSIFSK